MRFFRTSHWVLPELLLLPPLPSLQLEPGVYRGSVEPHPPSLRAEPSHPEEAELYFWLVRPGGGLEGADFGGRGTFHSSWAKEELDTEVPPGDHLDSLGWAEVLCAVLVREPLWLEARMDDQALLEGIVVFSDEDGPLFLSLRWSVSRTVLMERLLMTLPGVTYGSVSGSTLG